LGLSLSPAERSMRARIGGLSLHSQYDSRELTKPARTAALARFDREVDPEGILPEAERARRSELARKAYFAKLALKSAKVRRARKAATP